MDISPLKNKANACKYEWTLSVQASGYMLNDVHILKQVQVPLIQLSVLADQENGALDMVNTAEVICQIK